LICQDAVRGPGRIRRNSKKGWPLLAYHDGGSFLRIEDDRQERREVIKETIDLYASHGLV
jgi:hypothetical protein